MTDTGMDELPPFADLVEKLRHLANGGAGPVNEICAKAAFAIEAYRKTVGDLLDQKLAALALPVPVAGESDLCEAADIIDMLRVVVESQLVRDGQATTATPTSALGRARAFLHKHSDLATLATERVSDQVQATSGASATECDHRSTERAAWPSWWRDGAMRAQWTCDPDPIAGNLYYFAPLQAAAPPYLQQRHVDAIIDIAADGTLAGVELIDNMPPPPTGSLIANQENLLRSEPETSSPALPEKAVAWLPVTVKVPANETNGGLIVLASGAERVISKVDAASIIYARPDNSPVKALEFYAEKDNWRDVGEGLSNHAYPLPTHKR